MSSSEREFKDYTFGPWPISADEVFITSPLSFAFVNLKPVVPGHVLVSTKRCVPRFTSLTPAEVSDLWQLAQNVGAALEKHTQATSLTLAIQDGKDAGQTVPHVHVHVLPRRSGDFEKNDDVYDAIDNASKDMVKASSGKKGKQLDLDAERKVRTREEMAAEAAELRTLF